MMELRMKKIVLVAWMLYIIESANSFKYALDDCGDSWRGNYSILLHSVSASFELLQNAMLKSKSEHRDFC